MGGASRLKVPPHGVPRQQLDKFNPPSWVHYFQLHHLVSQSPRCKFSIKTQFRWWGYLCAATTEGRPRRGIDSPLPLLHSSASLTVGLKLSLLLSASSARFSPQFSSHQPCNNKSGPASFHSASSLFLCPVVESPITFQLHLFLFSSTLAHFIDVVPRHVVPFLLVLIKPDNEAAEQNIQCDGTFRHNCRICSRSLRKALINQSLQCYRNICLSDYVKTKFSGIFK